jgi:hypothetical protein
MICSKVEIQLLNSQSELWISVLEKAYMKEHDTARFFSAKCFLEYGFFYILSMVRYGRVPFVLLRIRLIPNPFSVSIRIILL